MEEEARHLIDPEVSASTKGYTPLRMPRPPQPRVSSTGVDTVFVRDLPRFLLDRFRSTLKWEGPRRLHESMRYYVELLGEARVLDARTARNLEAQARSIEENPREAGEFLKSEIEPYLKELEATARGEGENDG